MEAEPQTVDLKQNFEPEEGLDTSSECTVPSSFEDCNYTPYETVPVRDGNYKLHERINSLRTTIQVLKEQLQEERENWQREIRESRENDYFTRTTQLGIDYYADYDRYHDLILQTQYESRQNIQKQIALANYKRRLLEVENMCTLELLRVKQSVQILQPLQVMANEWKFESEAGDFRKETLANIYADKKEKIVMSEVQMPFENVCNPVGNTRSKEQIPCVVTTSDPVVSESESRLEKQTQSEPSVVASESGVNSQLQYVVNN